MLCCLLSISQQNMFMQYFNVQLYRAGNTVIHDARAHKNRFRVYVVTRSYSSCPFLCPLDDVHVAAETVNCLYILPSQTNCTVWSAVSQQYICTGLFCSANTFPTMKFHPHLPPNRFGKVPTPTHPYLFEELLVKQDISCIEVCKKVVWVQGSSSLIVFHCTGHISHELVDDTSVSVQCSTGRQLEWKEICRVQVV